MKKQQRSGCSGLFMFGVLVCLILAVLSWPSYVSRSGVLAPGVISEKQETVRIHYGDWYRHFLITATYTPDGQRMAHRASCDVNERTYDSLHVGNAVSVRYLPNLLTQPFLPATRLSPCSGLASINLNPSVLPKLGVAAITLLIIIFLWRVLRIRFAGALLVPWFALTIGTFVIPRAEPAPRDPRPAQATIGNVVTVSNLLDSNNSSSIPLQQPFQVVELKYLPPGMDLPVTAIDKVDVNSVPNLRTGQTVNITYDAANPRTAQIQGATRMFPGYARTTLILTSIAFVAFLLIATVIGSFFRFLCRNPLVRAARANAVMRRRRL